MSNNIETVTDKLLDDWATKPEGPVALRLKQELLPVEQSGIIFPPTYADIGYNIDTLSDGTRLATIDSVGSQANRLEPIFESRSANPDDWLVPQICIVIGTEPCRECDACQNGEGGAPRGGRRNACTQPREVTRSLLDLAHRAADAVVRLSPGLRELIESAFNSLKQGDAGPLCTIAPTSLVFGVWDSRGAGEKRPRLIRSIIRAWDVEPLHSAAQFNSIWKLLDEAQQKALEKAAKGGDKETKLSSAGLKDAPATFRKVSKSAAKYMKEFVDGSPNPERRVLGGVLTRGRIEREVTVNLVALRGLRGNNDSETDAIRKYLLGLALMAATADIELFLREGCLLRYAENGDQWYKVPRRGEPDPISLKPATVKTYATHAAEHFRSEWPKKFQDKWLTDSQQFSDLKYKFNLDKVNELFANQTADEEPAGD